MIAILAGAVLALFAGCSADVLHGLAEPETNRVIAVLQEQGIPAAKEMENEEEGTWKVTVAQSDLPKVWGILQEYRLPTSPNRRFRDVFGKSKLVVAPIEERALYLEALQGEIAHTIEGVSGVLMARVHLVIPEPSLTGQSAGEPKASVMVEFRADAANQAPLQTTDIQRIVASAVAGLEPSNVSVVMKETRLSRMVQSYSFVSLGPLVVAESSLAVLKLIAAGVGSLIVLLALLVFWQGRLVGQLRASLATGRDLRPVPARKKEAV